MTAAQQASHDQLRRLVDLTRHRLTAAALAHDAGEMVVAELQTAAAAYASAVAQLRAARISYRAPEADL